MLLPSDRKVFQNAWVVPNLETAARQWIDTFGIGPFFILDHRDDIIDITYRGRPADLKMRLAIAQAGPVQIELVEQVVEGPSCYRDLVPAGARGFHHVCTWTHDLAADIAYYAAKGCPAATTGRVRDSIRFAYFDTAAALGCMVEVMEYSPVVEHIFNEIKRAANDWDGRDPIRSF